MRFIRSLFFTSVANILADLHAKVAQLEAHAAKQVDKEEYHRTQMNGAIDEGDRARSVGKKLKDLIS